MTKRLYRCYGLGYLHFITSSCYQRRPFLNTPRRRNLFVRILEETRKQYNFVVVGYVVMPEHIHLIVSEPEHGTPSTVVQVVKQRFARRVLQEWRKRKQDRPAQLWNGSAPVAGLRQFKDALYGTTSTGGPNSFGTVYEVTF